MGLLAAMLIIDGGMFGQAIALNRRKRRLIQQIKARGHFEVDPETGQYTWIPGTWKTPCG